MTSHSHKDHIQWHENFWYDEKENWVRYSYFEEIDDEDHGRKHFDAEVYLEYLLGDRSTVVAKYVVTRKPEEYRSWFEFFDRKFINLDGKEIDYLINIVAMRPITQRYGVDLGNESFNSYWNYKKDQYYSALHLTSYRYEEGLTKFDA